MSEKEFEEAFSDEKFVQELLNLKTGEQVRKALAQKGIFLTAEELDKFAEVLIQALEKRKLPEDELKNCSGGSAEKSGEVLMYGAEVLACCINPENIAKDSFWHNFLG